MLHPMRDGEKALAGERAAIFTSRSVVPHTGFEWHSLLSKAPEFPPVQLALYPSLPLLDPSCTLSTGWKNNKDCREGHTGRPGQGIQTDRQYGVQALMLAVLAQSHQASKLKKKKKDKLKQ